MFKNLLPVVKVSKHLRHHHLNKGPFCVLKWLEMTTAMHHSGIQIAPGETCCVGFLNFKLGTTTNNPFYVVDQYQYKYYRSELKTLWNDTGCHSHFIFCIFIYSNKNVPIQEICLMNLLISDDSQLVKPRLIAEMDRNVKPFLLTFKKHLRRNI